MAPEQRPDRLTSDEVALVLRRAAELDPTTAPMPDEGLSVEAVEAAAAEVGLPASAVRQAIAELRTGVLDPEPGDRPPLTLVEAGVVPYAPDEALAMVGRWLESQAFHRHRLREGVETWRPREDVLAKLQRGLDWMATVRLKDVREVTVRAVAVTDGTLVRVEATLSGSVVSLPGIGAGAGGVIGSGVGVVGGMVSPAGPPGVVAAGAAVAGLGAVGGWWAGRRARQSRAEHVADEVSAHLDRIGHGDDHEPRALRRLRRRMVLVAPRRRHHR